MQLDFVFAIPVHASKHELFGIPMGKERSEPNTIVRGARFLAESDDSVLPLVVQFDDLLDKAMTNHPVADHHKCFFALANHVFGFDG